MRTEYHYVTDDGRPFLTVEEAAQHEHEQRVEHILTDILKDAASGRPPYLTLNSDIRRFAFLLAAMPTLNVQRRLRKSYLKRN